jgi:hypothetical protein
LAVTIDTVMPLGIDRLNGVASPLEFHLDNWAWWCDGAAFAIASTIIVMAANVVATCMLLVP